MIGGEFVVNEEADEVRWVSIDEARSLVTYDRDRELLDLVEAQEAIAGAA